MFAIRPDVYRASAIILVVVMVSVNTHGNCFAQCDNCSRPRIALYDFDMQVPRPQADTSIVKWMNLFWTGIQARSLVRQNEPNAGCLSWYDGALINAATLQGGTLKFGSTYANLPPPGPMSAADYILSGSTTGAPGAYTSVLTLETAESREMVKSVSVNYDNVTVDPSTAGSQLAAQFGSIFTVIKDFERYKRDTDTHVAIRDLSYKGMPDEVEVKPARTTASAGDTVDVEITLMDCDDVPLKGRILYLDAVTVDGNEFPGSENGNFTEAQVTTDDQGKAKAKFVPAAPGLAVCHVNFPHVKPTGRKDGFIGTAYINVPKETQQFDLIYSRSWTCKGDTAWTQVYDDGATEHFAATTSTFNSGQFHVKGLLERDYSVTDHKVFQTILSVSGTGSLTGSGYGHSTDVLIGSDGGSLTITGTDTYNLRAHFDKSYLDFTIDLPQTQGPDDYPEGGLIFRVSGDNEEHSEDCVNGDCQSYGGTNPWDDDYGTSFGAAVSGETHERTDNSFTKTHHGVLTQTDNIDFAGHLLGYTLREEYKWDWTATITPYEGTTGIDNGKSKVPTSFLLEQNYPNPFNPLTIIKYTIAGARDQGPGVSNTRLVVYDLLGREVKVLVNEQKAPGNYEVSFDGSGLASGVYLYRLTAGSFVQTMKMILVK